MQAVLNPDATSEMPRVRQWLGNSDACAEIVSSCYAHLAGEARVKVLVQENVLTQLEHVRTHPSVASGLASGELKLHAWVYKMETGEVFSFNPDSGQFSLLMSAPPREAMERESAVGRRRVRPAMVASAI